MLYKGISNHVLPVMLPPLHILQNLELNQYELLIMIRHIFHQQSIRKFCPYVIRH